MTDIARKAGVSVTTVSYVISGKRHVQPETRERVRQAMVEMNYQPNFVAQAMRSKRTYTVGLVIPDNANPFFAEVSKGIEDASFESGYRVILCNTARDMKREEAYLTALRAHQVDGIIILTADDASASAVNAIMQQGVPVVCVDRVLLDIKVDVVRTDNIEGSWKAVSHLIRLGHRRIACIAGRLNLLSGAHRVDGYRRAFQDVGFALEEHLIGMGNYSFESGYKEMKALLSLPQPPTAVFACNDPMAIGAMRAIADQGLRVAEDIAVVGYGGIELGNMTIPRLTTVSQPRRDLGVQALRLLLLRLHARGGRPKTIVLPTELVVRESCGAKLKDLPSSKLYLEQNDTKH